MKNRSFGAFGETAVEFQDFDAEEGKTVEVVKYASVYTEREVPDYELHCRVRDEIADFLADGFETEMNRHMEVYARMWDDANIEIQGDFELDRAVRFTIFHLMSTGSEHDDRVNVGAKLLSGEEYGGHAFWDTELFMLPFFIQQNFGIELPSTLEIIILLFIFAAEILGELGCYFITYPYWDSMLHTTTGFLCAATGFALIDILNRNSRIKFQLSPVYVALAAFCFSMTVGVMWEFFEFGMDRLFHMDMQKDTVIQSVTSVMLDPTNSNIPVTIDGIHSVAVNGQDLGFDGYLDIGLYDTMEDLFVNFVGAVVFSAIGYFYIKHRGRGKLARAFIPTITEEEPEQTPE